MEFRTLHKQVDFDKSKGMPASKVENILQNKYPVLKLQDIISFPDIESMVGDGIVMYIPEDDPMLGHYVCLFIKNGTDLFWWDSYGMNLNGLEYSNWLGTTQDGMLVKKYLYKLLDAWKGKQNRIIYNFKKYQKLNKDVATCGRHASVRLLYKDLDNDQYERFLKYKSIDMDDLVTLLTCLAD